ncbi:type IV pilus assembly protein PilW [Andreprevotia lacus DSM 23236]|jgi:type IV pilus assembly protein PilW|uniref:Type IV pilus assembly protein PilW n=1 Tax=Andreprevotia lacus DSM 23236 TaxID=1121001 RepID=A0A1W1XC81_9NEIS|nr:PilW family protein [Andreprevotia lacus]SMC21131.1 type IV pilus assembly protein PilW [Andreprevotia lacus DSM 23236]
MHTRKQTGFTIVELMVGITLGLLSTLVVMQVFSSSEGQKRTTTGGSDAQTTSSLALYTLERELRGAGYGLTSNQSMVGCNIKARYGGTTNTLAFNSPVVITDGASGASDSIRIFSGTAAAAAMPVQLRDDMPDSLSSSTFKSFFPGGINNGDLVVFIPTPVSSSTWCSVIQATQDGKNSTNGNISHVATSSAPYNDASTNIFPSGGYKANDYFVDIGQLVDHTYYLDQTTGTLKMDTRDLSGAAATTSEVFSQVVNMQAKYGKDTNGDNTVDAWNNSTPATAAAWLQIRAVRLAVLSRNSQWDKNVVTSTAPSWDCADSGDANWSSSSSKCTFTMPSGTDWQHYRYKVAETVVPLRNMIWSQ